MYVPKHFTEDDPETIQNTIKSARFASLISAADDVPYATHLPLHLDTTRGEYGTLLGHVARANEHWRQFDGKKQALAIFTGINAYIGPNWYSSKNTVPTWNYMAVHAYGAPHIIKEPDDVLDILAKLTAENENDFTGNWTMDKMDQNILRGMLKGIVAFEMPIKRLEAKSKLGQNKKPEDTRGAVDGLRRTKNPMATDIATEMERRLKD